MAAMQKIVKCNGTVIGTVVQTLTEICVQRRAKHVTVCRYSRHCCQAALLLFFSAPLFAMTFSKNAVYVGINVGAGSTEWKYLVDKLDENGSLNVSTPSKVTEGGPSW